MKKILIVIFSILIALPTLAEGTSATGNNQNTGTETVTISGTIVEADTNETLPGATIQVLDAKRKGTITGTASDSDGKFTLQNVPSDASIKISYVGYEPETISVSELENNKNETIQLKWVSQELEAVEVPAQRNGSDCTQEQLEKINAKSGKYTIKKLSNSEYEEYCMPTECNEGFILKNNKCEKQNESESPTENNEAPINEDLPLSTDTGGLESEPQPTLSEEDQKAKIAELKSNADAMKEKEQSTENKLLSGASMGAMGIAGMQTLSALSEQRADQQAEQDMTAYLATFRCDFGQGKFIKGGQTNVELPGAGQLSTLYNEYMNLAEDLKTRKESLGLAQGIESEVIIDTSVINLYDDVGTGINGTFTSLAKALSDSTSADAAEWAEQKEKTSQQIKNGIITMVTTAVASTAINKFINDNKPKELSKEIIAKYDAKRQQIREDLSSIETRSEQDAQTAAATENDKTPTTQEEEEEQQQQPQQQDNSILTIYSASLFDSGGIEITEKGETVLDEIISKIKEQLAEEENFKFILASHTDKDQIRQTSTLCTSNGICNNDDLSEKRATVTKDYLIKNSEELFTEANITICPMGDSMAKGTSPEEKANDRYINIFLYLENETLPNCSEVYKKEN